MTCQRAIRGREVGGLEGGLEEGCQEGYGRGLVLRLGDGSELEGEMGEVRHLGWAGVGVEEVEEVGVVGWETVAEVDGFHWGKEGVGCVVVVEVARASCE